MDAGRSKRHSLEPRLGMPIKRTTNLFGLLNPQIVWCGVEGTLTPADSFGPARIIRNLLNKKN